MATSEMNTYVPAHQLRNNGSYLWVKWWSGDDTNYAHFHQTADGKYLLTRLGRNGAQIAEKHTASLDDLPDGLLEALQVRYDLTQYEGRSR